MNGIVLAVAMLVSSTGGAAAPPALRPEVAPAILRPDHSGLWKAASGDPTGGPLVYSSGPRRQRGPVRSAQTASAKHSKMDRVIAIAAGASLGWVAGGGIGCAVIPKRSKYDDTTCLKGVLIGAPIGAVAGVLIGYRLTK